MIPKVTCSCKGRFLRIFINDLPHFTYEIRDIKGYQSWIHSKDWCCIEYETTQGKVLCEYDNKDLWSEILKLLAENLI